MPKPNILLVGHGKMGGALLTRWTELGLYNQIHVVEPAPLPDAAIPRTSSQKEIPAAFKPDIVVFAVKPQSLPDLVDDYRAYDALCLSIAAGKPIAFFEHHLGAGARIIRSMPNTPAAIGRGMTVACANKNVSTAEKETAERLLSAVGETLWVDDERLLDPVTALSGSGPAYVFLLTEILAKAGEKIGLEPGMAAKLARQTVIGSAALMELSPDTPAKLRENVTSPGGTTAAALEVLMRGETQKIFDEALTAATLRAQKLAQ